MNDDILLVLWILLKRAGGEVKINASEILAGYPPGASIHISPRNFEDDSYTIRAKEQK